MTITGTSLSYFSCFLHTPNLVCSTLALRHGVSMLWVVCQSSVMVFASFPTETSCLSSFGRELSPLHRPSEHGPCMCRGFVPAVCGCYRFSSLYDRHVCPGSAEKSCHVSLGRHLDSNKMETIRPWSVHVQRLFAGRMPQSLLSLPHNRHVEMFLARRSSWSSRSIIVKPSCFLSYDPAGLADFSFIIAERGCP